MSNSSTSEDSVVEEVEKVEKPQNIKFRKFMAEDTTTKVKGLTASTQNKAVQRILSDLVSLIVFYLVLVWCPL